MTHPVAVAQDRISRGIGAARHAAGRAPTFVDQRAWYWRIENESLELWADPDIQPSPADPDGRLLAYSCGAAVHHARVALAGRGMGTMIHSYPDPAHPDCVAWLTVHDLAATTPVAERMCAALDHERRCSVPRSGERLDTDTFRAVALAAHSQWCFLTRLDDTQIQYLDRALAGTPELTGVGQPAPGTAPLGPGRGSTLALLTSPCDNHTGWFNAGQAWSAIRLAAADLGRSVTVVPATLPATAAAVIHRELPLLGYPNFVLRFGRPL